ncbi:MAG TPA: VOC family protein [Candidatus Limnocylindria bacterium]|nr:VOC family protein [Candidatus Limnocylindria bacterium]
MSSITHVFMQVLDLQRSKAFYESLGLKIVMDEPKYVRLACENGFYIGMEQRDATEIGGSGIELNIQVDDIDKLYEALSSKDVAFEQKPTDMPWGARHAFLKDPNGYRVGLYS